MTPLYEILSGAKPKYDGRNQNTSSFWWGRDMTDGEGRPRNFLECQKWLMMGACHMGIHTCQNSLSFRVRVCSFY